MTIDETTLNAYLDGELSDPERRQVEQALAASPSAQALLTRLHQEAKQVNRTLDQLAPLPPATSPAWLALKQLRTRLNLAGEEPACVNGSSLTPIGSNVWESPPLLHEMKTGLGSLRRRPLLAIPKFRWTSLALVSLLLMILPLAGAWWAGLLPTLPEAPVPASAQLPTVTPTPARLGATSPLPHGTTPISATFGAEVELLGYDLPDEVVTAGQEIHLTLYWRARQSLDQYVSFAHLFSHDGLLLSQHDNPLSPMDAPAGTTAPGEIIPVSYVLLTTPDLPETQFELFVGVYDSRTNMRLPVQAGPGQAQDTLRLAQITVKPGVFKVEAPLAVTSEISTTHVYVALQPISQGARITSTLIGSQPWPVAALPQGFIIDKAETIGKIANQDIKPGQVIVRSMFAEAASPLIPDLIPAPTLPSAAAPLASNSSGRIFFQTELGIYALNPDGSGLELAATGSPPRPFSLSANGDLLAFTSGTDLHIADTQTTQQFNLTRSSVMAWKPAWSPDGQKIAFVSSDSVKRSIYIVDVAGADWTLLTANGDDPAWSPDGRQLAFVSDILTGAGIQVINSDGTGLTPLTDNDEFEHVHPAWSPTGRKIAFAAGPQGKFDIYLINPDGSELTRLTHLEASDMRPFWSPDGRQIAFTAQKGDQSAIYIIAIDQAQPVRLNTGSRPAWFGAWSPYGQQLVFLSGPERETAGLYLINADGSGLVALQERPEPIFSIAWSPQINPPALPAVEIVPASQTEMVIVLDISGSMAAEDLHPNRLNAAKAVIRDFIDHRPGDRLGFATFASEVVGQIQPTLDHTMLKAAVDSTRLSWDIGLDSGTALGLGLNEAVEMLQDSTAANKVIILLTDGANNAGNIDPLVAAKQALAYGIRVHTIGAAQQGPARLVFPDGRIEHRDSEIDEATLQEIAALTGGRYFRAEDNEGLKEIYNNISQLEGGLVAGVIITAPVPALPSFAPAPLPASPALTACPPIPVAPLAFMPFESSTLGFTLAYPEAWHIQEHDNYVILSPSEAGLDPITSADTAFWAGKTPDLGPLLNPGFPKWDSSFELLNEGPILIGSDQWDSTQFRFKADTLCGQGIGMNATLTKDGQRYFLGVIAPAPYWNDIQPVFQEMLNSFQFAP